jgi:hypothetical protein
MDEVARLKQQLENEQRLREEAERQREESDRQRAMNAEDGIWGAIC